MSLMRILDITGSGMSAQSIRLNTIASNLANADSVSGSEETTYRARKPIFAAAMADANNGVYPSSPEAVGVKVLGIVETNDPLKKEYNPGHPLANADGYIMGSNVNVMQEMGDMIAASRSYEVDAKLADAVKDLVMQTIRIGQ